MPGINEFCVLQVSTIQVVSLAVRVQKEKSTMSTLIRALWSKAAAATMLSADGQFFTSAKHEVEVLYKYIQKVVNCTVMFQLHVSRNGYHTRM